MKKKRLSIDDIAKALQVSKACVSLILNGKARQHRISKALEEKVVTYAKEHNFIFNAGAQALTTGKSKVIALLVERISDSFFSQIAYHLEKAAHEQGYRILYSSSENNLDKLRDFIKLYKEQQVDGFIMVPSVGSEQELKSLIDERYPLVLFQNSYPELLTSHVVLDDYNAVQDAAEFFINKKSKTIAYVDLDSNQSYILNRRKGYLECLERNNLPHTIKSIPYNTSNDFVVNEIVNFLKANSKIDTIFFVGHGLAVNGLKAISIAGRKISVDINVIVFDGSELFDSLGIDISIIVQPVEEMSKQLFRILHHQIFSANEENVVQQILMSGKLRLKESVYTKHHVE